MMLTAVAAISCDGPAPTGADVAPYEQTTERGPVKLTTTVDRPELTVGDRIVLTLDVLAEPGVDVRMPEVEAPLGTFDVLSSRTPPDVPDGERRRWTHRYTLSTFEAGEPEIPSLSVGFVDGRVTDEPPIEGMLSTEPFALTVHSVLDAGTDADTWLRIKEFVRLPLAGGVAWWWAVVAALILVGGWLIWRHRRRRGDAGAAPPPLLPHLWARRELRRLAGDRLLEGGRIHEYYVRLSGIVREYIERRFRVMAPERTTEEFLREVRDHPALRDDHRRQLAEFLRAADMVKFARHLPGTRESEGAFEAARTFVDETAEHDPTTSDAEDGADGFARGTAA